MIAVSAPLAASVPVSGVAPAPSAVSLRHVRKAYKVYERPFSFLREVLTGKPCHTEKPVLHDISLDIRRGEVVGIIGRNGAGKSTLLKLIAGTLAASSGEISVNGRVSAILELGTGFNPAYSGRDNVILSALMRGMPEAEVRRKFDAIVAFSGLEEVIDQPFHTYSSGMQARLAFAAAVSVEADVIIIDEALAAGDARFTARSLRRIREICDSGVTALFVSHTTYQIMQLCTRAVWIDGGRIRMDGAPIEVVRAYEYELHQQIAQDQGRMVAGASDEPAAPLQIAEAAGSQTPCRADEAPSRRREPEAALAGVPIPLAVDASAAEPAAPEPKDAYTELEGLAPIEARAKARRFSTGQYRMLDVAFLDRRGRPARAFRFGERFTMRVGFECLLPEVPEYSCGLAVAFNRTSDFEPVMYFNTNYPHSDAEIENYFDAPFRQYLGRRGSIEAVIEPLQLKAGEYYVSFGILPNQPGMHEFYEYAHCQERVAVLPNGFDEPSVFYPLVSWRSARLDEAPAAELPSQERIAAAPVPSR